MVKVAGCTVHTGVQGKTAAALAESDIPNYPGRDLVEIDEAKVGEFNEVYDGFHFHENVEVRYFMGGTGTFWVREADGTTLIPVEKGDFVLIPARIVHRFQSGPQGFKARRYFKVKDGGGLPTHV